MIERREREVWYWSDFYGRYAGPWLERQWRLRVGPIHTPWRRDGLDPERR